jgi:integrase
MNPQQPDTTTPINQLQNIAMNIVEVFCSIICLPVEIILRPQYGTRYYPRRRNQDGRLGRLRPAASAPGRTSARLAREHTPYPNDGDFVFPSLKMKGRIPLSTSIFVQDYLRPAAIAAGAQIAQGQRFGLHNLRHSLSNWLVNKAKVEPKTVQGILRHSRIQTTLDLYTQEDSDEARAAQGQFLKAVMASGALQ